MSEEIENPEINNSPALHISNIVYGRECRSDGRVTYLPYNELLEGRKVIPENVVLKRWKKEIFQVFRQRVSG